MSTKRLGAKLLIRGVPLVAPAADEVNYLQAVAFGKLGLWPLLAGHDIAVEFDGYPIRFHA